MIKNILFDWSGTIVDNLTTSYKATMYIFESFGVKPMTIEDYREKFFLPYVDFLRKYVPDCSEERMRQLFKEGYRAVNDTKFYPEVKNTLKRLHDKGIKMVIMSSGSQEEIIIDAKKCGIFNYFQEINGNILDKTEVITEIIQRNNFKPEETIYVGDMPHDIEAGKKGGVVSVGISWGHKSKESLEAADPDHVISNIVELEQLLD